MLNTFKLATKFLWRDARLGEWGFILLALIIAISAFTSLHFYADRLLKGLVQQSAKFLGGDIAISSSSPIPSTWLDKAKSLNLKTAEVWFFTSMVSRGNNLQLATIQAISNNYPLIGNKFVLKNKTILMEPRLLNSLSVHPQDAVTIGAASFIIDDKINLDNDALNTGWAIAPRILMRLDDVAATKTVIPGSRVDYRLLLVGEINNLIAFRNWLIPQLNPSQHIIDVNNNQTGLKTIVEKTQYYLNLVLLIILIMSGVAIALSVHQYLNRHIQYVALWRSLGASQKQIRSLLSWQLFLVAITAGLIGIPLGYFAQFYFAKLFNSIVNFPLPEAGSSPVILGFIQPKPRKLC